MAPFGLVRDLARKDSTPRGGIAINKDLAPLRAFLEDYPPTEARLLYGGSRRYREGPVEIIPFADGIRELPSWL